MRASDGANNRSLEQPSMRALVPDATGAAVLDLGCGAGEFARWLVGGGAISVLGIDPSANMLAVAGEMPDSKIEYRQAFVEDVELAESQFDLVVSSLVFHYVDDLKQVIGKIRSWIKPGGALVFSIEHPMTTAIQGKRGGWLKDDAGERIGWLVDDYSIEGERVSTWIVDDVVKYHRTLSTVLNMLVESGFRVDKVSEGYGTSEFNADHPEERKQQMRPRMLFVRAIAD